MYGLLLMVVVVLFRLDLRLFGEYQAVLVVVGRLGWVYRLVLNLIRVVVERCARCRLRLLDQMLRRVHIARLLVVVGLDEGVLVRAELIVLAVEAQIRVRVGDLIELMLNAVGCVVADELFSHRLALIQKRVVNERV